VAPYIHWPTKKHETKCPTHKKDLTSPCLASSMTIQTGRFSEQMPISFTMWGWSNCCIITEMKKWRYQNAWIVVQCSDKCRKSMLRQTMHVRIASKAKIFSLLIGQNDVVRYDVTPFVVPNVISDGMTNGWLTGQWHKGLVASSHTSACLLCFNLVRSCINKSRSEPGNAPLIGIGHREEVCQK